jgi:hypothetical protein
MKRSVALIVSALMGAVFLSAGSTAATATPYCGITWALSPIHKPPCRLKGTFPVSDRVSIRASTASSSTSTETSTGSMFVMYRLS